MKKSILSLGFFLISILLTAAPVNPRTAQTVARNFWIANGGDVTVSWTDLTAQTAFTEFYIFSSTTSEGFVIVSADDCVIPILGYSMEHTFNPKMPAHIVDYLDGMNREIAFCKTLNFPINSELANLWASLINGSYTPRNTTTVAPLITTTWAQSPRYNNLCPGTGSNQAITGCVATAMAQIMKFWNWPCQGVGSHSYTDANYGALTADFGATTYQWTLMPNELTYNSTAAEINAVATLMFHAGVSVEMDYGPDGSAAFSHDYGYPNLPCPQKALSNYFSYKNTLHSVYKDSVSNTIWVNTIKNELNAGRPMLHSGNDTAAGGHAFICDGYDSNDLFHFNWGWDGYCDGYYAIDNLSPQPSGGTALYSFNLYRAVLVGIEPDSSILDTNPTITVNVLNPSMGSTAGGGHYPPGTSVTISAFANPHYHFTQWNDGNTENPRVITITTDTTFTAYFAANQYQITVASSNPGIGSVTGGGTYAYGTCITISATPNSNYTFLNWSDGDTNNPRNLLVSNSASYIANFQSTDGIEDRNENSITAFSANDQIYVNHAAGKTVEIYDITGRLIIRENARDNSGSVFRMNTPGLYIVKVGDHFKQKVTTTK